MFMKQVFLDVLLHLPSHFITSFLVVSVILLDAPVVHKLPEVSLTQHTYSKFLVCSN